MITPTQMRAARAMLDVSQGHVAEHLGIAANTLSKIESGQSDISVSRNTEIQRFYEREGIAFTDDDGVKWESNSVTTHKGQSGFIDFILDVYDTVKEGGEICVNNVNEDNFIHWEGDQAEAHMKRMASIENLSFKILVQEGDTNLVGSDYAEYREMSQDNFGGVPLYIYGDKSALIVFEKDNVEVFVIKHLSITSYFKERFNNAWKQAKK